MQKSIAIINHIKELQFRSFYIIITFIINFIVLYFYINETTYLCIKPLILNNNFKSNNLIFTDLSELFFCTVKLTFFLSSYLTIIIIIYQVYYFLIPGTYKHEQKKIFKILISSLILLLFSLFLTYMLIIPLFWNFFLTEHISIDSNILKIDYQGKIIEYINLLNSILFGFLISTQIPLILTFFLYNKIINVKTVQKYRSFNILFCFICGALFTPPDVLSQISLAIPLCALYEINIFFGIYLNKRETLVQIN